MSSLRHVPERNENLSRFLVFLLVVFLGLFSLHSWVQMDSLRRQVEQDQIRKLARMSEQASQRLGRGSSDARARHSELQELREQLGAGQISLLDRSGRSVGDSSGRIKAGNPVPDLGISQAQWGEVWLGKSILSAPFQNDEGKMIRAYYSPWRDPSERIRGVMRLAVALEEETHAGSVTGLLLKIFGGVAVAVLLYYGIRGLLLNQREAVEPWGMAGGGMPGKEAEATGGGGFVIDTFQGLIQQLKEKEQELNRLRRIAEERVEHVESYNENILQSVSSGVITFNEDAVITTFNLAAERILGMSSREVIGRPCAAVFGAEGQIRRLVQTALVQKQVTIRRELELSRPSASEDPDRAPAESARGTELQRREKIWVGVSTSLLMDKQDRVIGTTMVFTDISEIKRLQEQMELKKRLSMLGEMSAGIAHEFRNYMGTILGYAKLLTKKVRGGDSAHGMIQSIIQELEAMEHLIHELLDFSRSPEINLQPVNLRMLIEKVVRQSMKQANGSLPKLSLNIAPGLGRVPLDEVLIRQALSNLIQNALEAMPEGGELKVQARVRRKFEPPQSRRGAHALPVPDGAEVEIEVRDTGMGISPQVRDRIFLPFFTTKEKGTGLGLALVHKIILSHNGEIQVESEEGRGSTFRVYLPCEGSSSEEP